MALAVQALFLHDRLIVSALHADEREAFLAETGQQGAWGREASEARWASRCEQAVAAVLPDTRELAVAVVERSLEPGQLVTLTQDFYVRRLDDERARIRARLATRRDFIAEGHFSTSRLVGSTGRNEIFGHKSMTVLAYVGDVRLDASSLGCDLRPMFMGWRLEAPSGTPSVLADRREVWPQQIDQFSKVSDRRPGRADMSLVADMKEDAVKHAFAEIIGEQFVPKDWGGETSDLSTNRLSIDGDPLAAAFAFKGPGHRGKLHIADMGVRGDQALRLAQEPVDLLVIQHHDAVVAAVRNLMSAVARQTGKRFMIIDGATTALLLRAYGKLPS